MFKTITSIIFISTAAAIFFVWSQPAFVEINELKQQEASYNETLSNSKEIQKSISSLLDQYNAISNENLDRLDKILPSQADPIKFILEIERMIQKNGLVLKQIDIKKIEKTKISRKAGLEVSDDPFEEIPITMTVAGSYKSFYAFLSDLEKSLRLTDIKKLSFSSGKVDFYEFNISASVYWGK